MGLSAALALLLSVTGAQEVVSARMSAEIVEGSPAVEVHVEYEIAGTPGETVRLEVLGFGEASVEAVEVVGIPGSVPLAAESGSLRVAAVELPTGGRLGLRYRVLAAVEIDGFVVRVRLPVVVVDLPPATAGGAVFHADLDIPPSWSVSGSFPTGLRLEGGVLTGELAVVPSVVSVRGRTDGAWRPGLATSFDVIALLVLGGFGLLGWRHLRRVVREARG